MLPAFIVADCAGMLASLVGGGLLVLYARYPSTTSRLFLIRDSQTDDDTVRHFYDNSPGPLKIDTVRLCLSNTVYFAKAIDTS